MFTIWIYPLRVIITNKKYEFKIFFIIRARKTQNPGEELEFLLAGNYNKLFVQK